MKSRTLWTIYWLVVAATFAGGIVLVFKFTPNESTMGLIQKVFYFHLPIAICTFLCCFCNFVGSIGYLIQRKRKWDDFAAAGAAVSVLLCTGVLLTGILWARGAWGVWWTWSPRLTFSFMLWLLYVVYVLVRASIESSQKRAIVAAVYGLVAFLDVPLVYLSARLLPDIHPSSIGLAPSMKLTLGLCFIPIVLATIGLVYANFRVNVAQRQLAEAREQLNLQAETAAGGAL